MPTSHGRAAADRPAGLMKAAPSRAVTAEPSNRDCCFLRAAGSEPCMVLAERTAVSQFGRLGCQSLSMEVHGIAQPVGTVLRALLRERG